MSFKVESNSEEFKRVFANYVSVSGKSIEEAAEHQAAQYQYDLYRETKKVSPTRDFIMSIPQMVGWRIKRPKGWAVFTMKEPPRRNGKRANKERRAAWVKKPGEMNKRARSAGWTSLGWLSSAWSRRNKEGVRRLNVRKAMGRVTYQKVGTLMIWTFTNPLPGMEYLENKYNVTKRAVDARIADMGVYIQRKLLGPKTNFKKHLEVLDQLDE